MNTSKLRSCSAASGSCGRWRRSCRERNVSLRGGGLEKTPETPDHVLTLATAFCEIIQDRRAPELLALASKLNPELAWRPDPPPAEIEQEERELWRNTPAKSMRALMSVIYEGAEAMSLRWPEIAPAFARLRQKLAEAPADSTREIILIRDQARRYHDRLVAA